MSLNFIETKRSIKKVIDGSLDSFAKVSVVPDDDTGGVCVVVGAKWENSSACYFGPKALTELINHLTQIRDVLNETYVE